MITKLPIDRIRPDPDQPRKLFTQAEIKELAQSMRENGQLQAISVRADPARGAGYFMIAWGQRRYHAALHNAWTTINAEVVEMGPVDVRIAQIVENLQRQSMTPLEEAAAYQRELDGGMTVASLAARLGLKQPWRITERTALLKLEPEYQGLLATGNLTPSQAFEMSRLTPRAQATLFGAIKSGSCSSNSALRASAFALADAEAQAPLFTPLPTEPTHAEIWPPAFLKTSASPRGALIRTRPVSTPKSWHSCRSISGKWSGRCVLPRCKVNSYRLRHERVFSTVKAFHSAQIQRREMPARF